jgi:RNA polymerase sigma-70 factor (ECF subfamily)
LTTLDTQLLERARGFDAEALGEIYDRYSGPIYGYLYRYLGDAAQAEDLTSEVFLKLLGVLNTPRAPRDQLQAWLYRVAHNLAIDWYRQQSRHSAWTLEDRLISEEASPAEELERRQLQRQLRAAIRQLTPEQQQVILLRFGEGSRIAEVSQVLGKSEGSVKILQHRAIARLRKLLVGKGNWRDDQPES